MGSGAGGNLTCTGAFSGVPRVVPVPSTAGGIVYVAANQLTVGPTGVITASAGTLGRSSAAAGGYVLLRGRQVDLGTLQVTADGSVATSVLAFNNVSSPGYVAIHYVTGTTGTTSPPAATTVITTP